MGLRNFKGQVECYAGGNSGRRKSTQNRNRSDDDKPVPGVVYANGRLPEKVPGIGVLY